MINPSKKPVFVFIGTLKHHVDCIAPCVGKLLEKEDLGFKIHYCDQTQIEETEELLKQYDKDKYQIIAFDVSFIKGTKTRFKTLNNGIKPATFTNKEQNIVIGDLGILININGIYHGSLKNQERRLIQNYENKKIHKRVDRVIVNTYLALKQLIKVYENK